MTKLQASLLILIAVASAAVFFFMGAKPTMEELKKSLAPTASLYPDAKSVSEALNFINDESQDVHLSELTNGKWVLLYFGYTSCPDVCPIDLSKISQAYQLMKNADSLQVVFVSVDPMRDIGSLNNFASAFNSAFLGLTAHQDELMSISKTLGVYHEVVQSQELAQEDHSNHGDHSHGDHSAEHGDDFAVHKMINKTTGDIQKVETHEKHLELVELGYVHYEHNMEKTKDSLDSKKVAHYGIDHTSSYLLFNPSLELTALLTSPHEVISMAEALDKIIEALGKN